MLAFVILLVHLFNDNSTRRFIALIVFIFIEIGVKLLIDLGYYLAEIIYGLLKRSQYYTVFEGKSLSVEGNVVP